MALITKIKKPLKLIKMTIPKQMVLIHQKIDQILPRLLLRGKDERFVVEVKNSKAVIYLERRDRLCDIIQEEKDVIG